jgi:hypothetical protein
MAQREELDVALYRRALRWLPDMIDCVPPLPVPETRPVTLEELLAEPEAGCASSPPTVLSSVPWCLRPK